jgi:acylphosphatase
MGAGAETNLARLHAIVTGVVQGVNFRAHTQRHATRLYLAGWVRNLHDGSVEVVAEGQRERLQSLADFLRAGPPSAVVSDLNLAWEPYTGEFSSFDVRFA